MGKIRMLGVAVLLLLLLVSAGGWYFWRLH